VNKKALLEAALFVSDKPLSLEILSNVIGANEEEIKRLIEELKTDLEKEDHGIELVETPEGFELRLKPEYRDSVASLAPLADLGDGMMRTLGIIAIKQPIKQSIIVKYQGNKAYGYIKSLEEKGLIKTEKAGRTKICSLTSEFEKYFGKSADELKKILEEKVKKKETS
jgi:segregation and condensation protein B